MKKRLAIFLYSMGSGGAERVASILTREFVKKYHVTLVLMNDTLFYDIPRDVDIVFLEKSRPFENALLKLLKLPFLALKYKHLCKKREIDLSFSLMNRPNYVNIISRLFGNRVRVIVSERSTPSMMYAGKSLQSLVNRFLIRRLYPLADVVTANSSGNCNDLKNNFDLKDVALVYNPFDLKKIAAMSSQPVEMRTKRFTFVTVGRLDHNKNHRMLIDAVKKLDADLWIIGDGLLRSYLEEYIKSQQLEDRVILLGRQENPFAFMKKADCFVLSSRHEGIPNVLIEAMACGLPVISTDCQSGPREVLAPNQNRSISEGIEIAEYGILVPVDDAQSMLEAMQMVQEDKMLIKTLTKKVYSRAQDFELNAIVKKWFEVLD